MSFQSNFIVAVTVQQLEQLKALREELQAVREFAGTKGEISITLDTSKLPAAARKAKQTMQDALEIPSPSSRSRAGTAGGPSKKATEDLTRAIVELTTILKSRRPATRGPVTPTAQETQLATEVAAIQAAPVRAMRSRMQVSKAAGEKQIASLRKQAAEIQAELADAIDEVVSDTNDTVGGLREKLVGIAKQIQQVEVGMKTPVGGLKRTKVAVGGTGSTSSPAATSITFDFKPMEQTLDGLSTLIQQKIVAPLAKLADIDFSSMVANLERLVTAAGRAAPAEAEAGDTAGAAVVTLTPAARKGPGRRKARKARQAAATPTLFGPGDEIPLPPHPDDALPVVPKVGGANGIFTDKEYQRYLRYLDKNQAKREERKAKRAEYTRKIIERMPPEVRESVKKYGEEGLFFVPDGLPFADTSRRGRTSDLVKSELVRRIRRVAGAAPAPAREDMQSFPPTPSEGAGGRLIWGDQEVLQKLEARLAEYQQMMAQGDPVLVRKAAQYVETPLTRYWRNYGEEYNKVTQEHSTRRSELLQRQAEELAAAERGIHQFEPRPIYQRKGEPGFMGDFRMFPGGGREQLLHPTTGAPILDAEQAKAVYAERFQALIAQGNFTPVAPISAEGRQALVRKHAGELFKLESEYQPYWKAFADEARRNLGATNAMPYTPGRLLQFTGSQADIEKRVQGMVEQEFGLAPGALGLLRGRVGLQSHDFPTEGGQSIAPNRMTPAKVARILRKQYRDLAALNAAGEEPHGDVTTRSIVQSSLQGIYKMIGAESSPATIMARALKEGQAITPEMAKAAAQHMEGLAKGFPFLRNFMNEVHKTPGDVKDSIFRLQELRKTLLVARDVQEALVTPRGGMTQPTTEHDLKTARLRLTSVYQKTKGVLDDPDASDAAKKNAKLNYMAAYKAYTDLVPPAETIAGNLARMRQIEGAIDIRRPQTALEQSSRRKRSKEEADSSAEISAARRKASYEREQALNVERDQIRTRLTEISKLTDQSEAALAAQGLTKEKLDELNNERNDLLKRQADLYQGSLTAKDTGKSGRPVRSRVVRKGPREQAYELGDQYLAEAPYFELKSELDRLQTFFGELGMTNVGTSRLTEAEALYQAGKAAPTVLPTAEIAKATETLKGAAEAVVLPPGAPTAAKDAAAVAAQEAATVAAEKAVMTATQAKEGMPSECCDRIVNELHLILETLRELGQRGAGVAEAGAPRLFGLSPLTPEERAERFKLRTQEHALRSSRERRMANGETRAEDRRREQAALTATQLADSDQAFGGVGTASLNTMVSELFKAMNKMAGLQQSIMTLESRRRLRLYRGKPTADLDSASGKLNEQVLASYGDVNRLIDTAYAQNPYAFHSLRKDVLAYRGAQAQRLEAQRNLEQFQAAGGGSVDQERELVSILNERVRAENAVATAMRDRAAGVVQTLRTQERELTILDRFRLTMRRVLLYSGAGFFVYRLGSLLSNAWQQATGLESALARIQGIMGAGSNMRDQLGAGALSTAQTLGVPLPEVVSAMQTFTQAGYRGQDAVAATQSAMRGMVGAGLDPKQADDMLVALDRISNGAIKFEDVLDRVSRLESTRAISAGDLSSALQRVGSLAKQLQPNRLGNVDFADFVMGATTAIVERTRVSGDQAATALQFIFSRLQTPQVGRELQGRYGIKLAGNNPYQQRPLMDILGDVAAKYNEFQQSGQTVKGAQLLESVAGARQANLAAALFSNWDAAVKAASDSSLAIGDINRRTATQLDTFAAKLAQTSAAFTTFIATLLEQTGILDGIKGALDHIRGWLNFGSAHPITGLLGSGAGVLAATTGLPALIGFLAKLAGRTSIGTAIGVTALEIGPVARTIGLLGKVFGFLGEMVEPIGIVLLTVGAVVGLWKLLTRKAEQAKAFQEQYGATPFDAAAFQNTDTAKSYQARANELGLSGQELYMSAVGAARASMARFPGSMFRDFGATTKRGTYDEMRKAFLAEMEARGVDFSSAGDRNAQIEAAIEVLRNSARYGSAPNQEQVTNFSTQAKELGDKFFAQLTTSLPALDAVSRASILQSYGLPDQVKLTGFMGRPEVTDAITKATNGLVDFGDLALSGSDKFGKAMDFIVSKLNSGSTLAQALDNLTTQFYTLSRAQEADVGKAEARARLKLGAGASDDEVQLAATAFLPADVAARVRNRVALRANIRDNVASLIGMDTRLGYAKEANRPAARGVGSIFSNSFYDLFQSAVGDLITKLKSSVNPDAQKMTQFLQAMLREGNRNKTDAALQRISGRGLIRDRYLDAIIAYNVGEGGIGAQEGAYRRIGLSFNAPQARLDNALTLVKTLGQIPAQIAGDLFKTSYKLGHAVTGDEVLQEMINHDIQSSGRLQFTPEMISRMQAASTTGNLHLSQSEAESLAAQRDQLQAAAGVIKNNDELFKYLSATERSQLLGVLGNAAKVDPATVITDAQTLNRLAERASANAAALVDLYQQQTAELMYQNRLSQSRLALEQGVAKMARDASARSAGILGSPADQLRAARSNVGMDWVDAMARANLTRQSSLQDIALRQHQGLMGDNEARQKRDEAERQYRLDLVNAEGEYRRSLAGIEMEYQLQIQQEYSRRLDSSVENATSGLRGYATSYEAQHSSNLQTATAQIFGSVGTTAFANIGNAFTDALVGKEGLFRGPLEAMFKSPAQQEAEMIYNAHMSGIVDGFMAAGNPYATTPGVESDGIQAINAKFANGVPTESLVAAAAGLTAAGLHPALKSGAGAPKVVGLGGGKTAALKALKAFAATEGGTLLGDWASPFHTGQNYASEGAAMGSLIGSAIPGIGTIIGGLAGGLLGGLFGKKQPRVPPELASLDRIERNTRETVTAIENQTAQLLTLDTRLLNVPTGFSVPNYRPLAVGSGSLAAGQAVAQSVQITITDARDPKATAAAVVEALQGEARRAGTFVSSRY